MDKRVILVTGTPCIGKTTVAKELARRLDARYVNLTELAKKHNLTIGEDQKRHTTIVDEDKLRAKLAELIVTEDKPDLIIDGHYAAAVTPNEKVNHVFVLRRNPVQLRELMLKCGFNEEKQRENLASEILDVCLVEALQEQGEGKTCELDVTDKSVEEIVEDILATLASREKCHAGGIDWLGMLEAQGILDDYLNI